MGCSTTSKYKHPGEPQGFPVRRLWLRQTGQFPEKFRLVAVVDGVAVSEAAFLGDSARAVVVPVVADPHGAEAQFAQAVADEGVDGLGDKAPAPVGLANPVSDFGLVVGDAVHMRVPAEKEAAATHGFAGLFQHGRVDFGRREYRAYYFAAFLHRGVGRPSRHRAHPRVGGIAEKRLGIVFGPWPQYQSFSFNHDKFVYPVVGFACKISEIFQNRAIDGLFVLNLHYDYTYRGIEDNGGVRRKRYARSVCPPSPGA